MAPKADRDDDARTSSLKPPEGAGYISDDPAGSALAQLHSQTTMVSSGQTYFIINKKAGTACDLSGQDQKSVIGSTAKGSDNQKVRFFLASR